MSSTTEILFNSPALHSLKRDQLIKLCKIHSIKASGKNAELVEKLKKYAETLPKNDPLSVASRSESLPEAEQEDHEANTAMQEQSKSSNARWGFQMPRPSEQWDVVMDKIDEAEEGFSRSTVNSLRAMTSTPGASDEFGMGVSKSPSVASSLKSLASSLGWNRGNIQKPDSQPSSAFPASSSSSSGLYSAKDDTLVEHSTPYSSLPKSQDIPETDFFTFDPIRGVVTSKDAPLPGQSLLPGVPAPSNARLSLGLNAPSTPTRDEPTTTIRLISNPVSNNSLGRTPQLKPFKTSFELEFGSPEPVSGFPGLNSWPQNEGKNKGIYPALPLDDLLSSKAPVTSLDDPSMNDMDVDTTMPGSITALPKAGAPTVLSPAPKAASTTELAVSDPFVFGSPLPQHSVSNTQFKSAAASVLEEMNKRLAQDGVNGVGMDLISRLQPGARPQIPKPLETKDVVKKGVFKEKFDEIHAQESTKMEGIDSFVKRRGLVPKPQDERAKRKSSVGIGRDRFGRRVAGESGRLSAAHVVGERRRSTRVIPGSFGDDDEDGDDGEGDAKPAASTSVIAEDAKEEDSAKAMEARAKEEAEEEVRKQKEKEAIKRMLEINKAKRRSSVGAAGAKGRVSVGRGGVLIKPQQTPAKPSRFGFLSSAKSLVKKVWGGGKSAAPAAQANKAAPAPAPAPKKAPVRPSTATNPPTNRVPSNHADKGKSTSSMNPTTSSQVRPPLPSLDSTRSSLAKRTRTSSATGSVKSSPAVSSLATRSSLASTNKNSSSGTIGSMGSKKLLAGSGSHTSVVPSTSGGSSSSRLSSASRLLAPTASSLAKINRPSVTNSRSNLKSVAQASGVGTSQTPKPQNGDGQSLGTITNSSRPPELWSPRPDKIFSKPLAMPPSKIPTPVKKQPTTITRGDGGGEGQSKGEMGAAVPGTPAARQRSLNGRKPRISRSKVIAKLASQRAAGTTAAPRGTPSAKAGRTRSSLGMKAQRSSYGGKPVSSKGPVDNVMMSARKRVRQSEYARRKSRVAPIDYAGGGRAMDVDVE
ncbi:hypothetical protein H0H92_000895 [Tricholoma furcatifolium]|nr:hypothetical protein H0H92_000895 [Tricholoma furcatifolium]